MEWRDGEWINGVSTWIIQYWLIRWSSRMYEIIISESSWNIEVVDNTRIRNIEFRFIIIILSIQNIQSKRTIIKEVGIVWEWSDSV